LAPPLSVVIVNFNSGQHLARCLASLAQIDDRDWNALVIDNASSDGSAEAAERAGGRVTLIRNRENVGFARAINQGIRQTQAPLVLILNPDCQLEGNAVRTLADELAAHDRCALIGPRLLDEDGTLQASARGDPDMLTGLFGRSSALRRWLPRARLAQANVRSHAAVASGLPSVIVDWVSGAAMLARRDALDRVGGLDERFFMYWEDADLCRRLRDNGFEIRYAPGARVVHVAGQSSRTVRRLALREFHRSAYLYYVTHVAPGRYDPRRWVARAILVARAWWTSRSTPHGESPTAPR
jgi:N-acetylglucosaminyl-diphospho-decaprenol L-rhamnosyltransferase